MCWSLASISWKRRERKEKKKWQREKKDSDITNQEGQLNTQVNTNIIGENSVKEAMWRYLLSSKKAKTFFRTMQLNSKNNDPVLLFNTTFRHWNCFVWCNEWRGWTWIVTWKSQPKSVKQSKCSLLRFVWYVLHNSFCVCWVKALSNDLST